MCAIEIFYLRFSYSEYRIKIIFQNTYCSKLVIAPLYAIILWTLTHLAIHVYMQVICTFGTLYALIIVHIKIHKCFNMCHSYSVIGVCWRVNNTTIQNTCSITAQLSHINYYENTFSCSEIIFRLRRYLSRISWWNPIPTTWLHHWHA